MASGRDLASTPYWDSVYAGRSSDVRTDPLRGSAPVRNVNRRIDEVLGGIVANLPENATAVELGCGASDWLPHLAARYGVSVTGVDYSESGCRLAERKLASVSQPGRIICADLFVPPDDCVGQFDLVMSFGVVEHFSDTAAALRAASVFAKPGGVVLTTVPNLAGTIGWFQEHLDADVYRVHRVLDADALRRAHDAAHLEVSTCDYFLSFNYGVLVRASTDRGARRVAKRAVWYSLAGFSHFLAGRRWIEKVVPPNRLTSPYILAVARQPS